MDAAAVAAGACPRPPGTASWAAARGPGGATSEPQSFACSSSSRCTATRSCKELAERSGGLWRPSPGSIYPTLQQLQDEGLVRSDEGEGGRRIFTLTDEGRTAAEAQDQPTAPWEGVSEAGDSAAISVRDMVGQVIVAARQVVRAGDEQQIAKAMDVLNEARRKIYRILAEEPGDDSKPEA